MARRGWVSAEVAPGTWRRLLVFDDGWVEVPGLARSLSDTRTNLRQALWSLGIFVGAIVLGQGLVALGAPDGVSVPFAVVALGALLWGAWVATRARLRNWRQVGDDSAQARAEQGTPQQLRRAPGAPLWRRASTARELASWVEGEVHVDAARVADVSVSVVGDTSRVDVRMVDGTTRSYTSPDRTLATLLEPFGSR